MIRRLSLVSSLVVLSAFGFANVARAGEGGVAGSAAFTINTSGQVIGVAVSAAVGKENAAAHAFNYDGSNNNGLQNSAFAIGTAGTLTINGLGDPAGFNLNTVEDTARTVEQANSFTTGYSVKLGTTSGAPLTAPAPMTP